MQILKVLSVLLSHPEAGTAAALPEIAAEIASCTVLTPALRDGLAAPAREIAARDPIAAEERYAALLEQSRSLSRHLFEPVCGESRERGQAMLDRRRDDERCGRLIAANALPGCLPRLLEFAATLEEGAGGHRPARRGAGDHGDARRTARKMRLALRPRARRGRGAGRKRRRVPPARGPGSESRLRSRARSRMGGGADRMLFAALLSR